MHADHSQSVKNGALTPDTPQRDLTQDPLLKAVVLYGEFESGVQARALLGRATDRAKWSGRAESLFWRFDVMSQPLVAREALYRAADADIILLAAQDVEYPPDWLLEWLEIWAITRRIQDAILAAWCRGHGEPSTGALNRLRELAGQYGLEFLCAQELVPPRRPEA